MFLIVLSLIGTNAAYNEKFFDDLFVDTTLLSNASEALDFIIDHSINETDNTLFDFCESRLHNRYPKSRALILLNSCHINYLLVYYSRPHSYIIFFVESNRLLLILQMYQRSPSWNPRAKFIFITINFNATEDGNFLSTYFKKWYLTNFIICTIDVDSWTIRVLTWDVTDLSIIYYQKEVTLDLVELLDLRNRTQWKPIYLFPKKRFLNYNFMKYRVAPVFTPPFLINNTEYPGAEGVLMQYLSHRINFTVELIENEYTTWGLKENGTYTDTFSLLQNHQADIVLGMVKPNITECQDFDCYYSNYLSDTVNWVVPRAGYVPEDETLKLLFTPLVWSLIFLVLGVFVLVWFLFTWVMELSYIHGLLNLWAMILSNPVVARPHLHPVINFLSFRFVSIIILFFNLILTTSFQSELINVLTNPVSEYQIQTQEEILSSGLSYGFHENVLRMFRSDDSPQVHTLVKNSEECSTSTACLNRTAFQKHFATCKTKQQLNYLTPKFYIGPDGQSLLYVFEKPIYWFPIAIVFTKGLPILERANSVLLRYAEIGFIARVMRNLNDYNWKVWENKQNFHKDALPLRYDHLSGVFLILGTGHLIAVVILIGEIGYYNVMKDDPDEPLKHNVKAKYEHWKNVTKHRKKGNEKVCFWKKPSL